MFTYLEHAGVEPTNNTSERILQHVVVSRKINGQIKGDKNRMKRYIMSHDIHTDMEDMGKINHGRSSKDRVLI